MLISDLYRIALLCICMTGVTGNTQCEEGEKARIDLDLAEHLIDKLKDLFPNNTGVVTNNSRCGVKEKVSVHLDKMKELIEEAKKNYPTCIEPITKDTNITETAASKGFDTLSLLTEPQEYPKSRDCSELFQSGQNVSGVYTIWSDNPLLGSLDVYCDMDTDGGGWTVIQRRGNFKPQEDFYRDWKDYREGFGNTTKDYWLGNHNIFILTNQRNYKVRFDLKSANGENAFALYDLFLIENEEARYKLHIGDYIGGNAGDDMQYFNGRSFCTKDRDNSGSCARRRMGAWWYISTCLHANLNGPYNPGAKGGQGRHITWEAWKGYEGLSGSEIKIRALAF